MLKNNDVGGLNRNTQFNLITMKEPIKQGKFFLHLHVFLLHSYISKNTKINLFH